MMEIKREQVNKVELLRGIGAISNELQDKFIEDDARFKLFRAGRRVGKSWTAAKDVFAGDIIRPGTRGWIVGPSYDLANKEFRYIIELLMMAHKKIKLPKTEIIRENPRGGELYIKTPWGSEVIGKSADKPQTGLIGEENDWVIMAETAMHKEETWERYVRPTLSSRQGRAIFTYTPDASGLWVYELELMVGEKEDWALYTCPAWECPHYNKKDIEGARQDLSEDAFYEQYGGEWRFYTGRVYKSFSTDIHVIKPFEIPKGWKVRAGIDFGVRDATAVLYLAQSPQNDFYFIGEYYAEDRPTVVHTEMVLGLEEELLEGKKPLARVADWHALGKQLILDWSKHKVSTVPCNVDRKTRRDRFLAFLEPRPDRQPFHVNEPGEYPRLFIFENRCPNLIRELLFLRWKDSTRLEGTYGDTIGDDHAIDAAEYVLYYSTQGFREDWMKRKATYNYKPVNILTGY